MSNRLREKCTGNFSGWDPESETARLTKGFVATPFPPLSHLTAGWAYDFGESCRQLAKK